MKTRQFVKMLKDAGCTIQRHGGNHDIWYSPKTGKTDAVPRHDSKEIKKGLLQSISKNLLGQ